MKHIQAGLLAAVAVTAAVAALGFIFLILSQIGLPVLVFAGLFIGVTIVAAIIDWKTEKKP